MGNAQTKLCKPSSFNFLPTDKDDFVPFFANKDKSSYDQSKDLVEEDDDFQSLRPYSSAVGYDEDAAALLRAQEKFSCNHKNKNPVVRFLETNESTNRDATRFSLFSRGGEAHASAIFDPEDNPHPFARAQCRRWEGSRGTDRHASYDFHSHVKSNEKQALENAKSLFVEVYGNPGYNQLEKQGGFFLEERRTLEFPLTRSSPHSVKIGTDCSGLEAPLIALSNMGVSYEHVFSCDNDPHVQKTILANHNPSHKLYKDIVTRVNVKVPYVDVYVAGFPCQPFSVAGKQQGFDDLKGRGNIFFHVLDYISVKNPKVFILENVKGLVRMENGKHLKKILKSLRQISNSNGDQLYEIHHTVLDTKEHGVPHSRPRWYCVGIRKDAARMSFEFPESISVPPIDSFLDDDSTKEIIHDNPEANKTMIRNIKSAQSKIQESGGSIQDPYVIDCDAGNNATCTRGYSPCITRSRNRGHWLLHRNRRMNVNEMLRLQGICPAEFKVAVSDAHLGQQIGNAMSVNVIERILLRTLLAAGLTRKGCIKGNPNVTRDRWAIGEGFAKVRSPCREVSELNASSHGTRQGWLLATSLKSKDRKFIIDSGSSFHLIGEELLTVQEREQRYKLEEPLQLHAAKGVVYAEWAVSIKIARLGISDEFVILQNVPAVMSLGKLVVDRGFRFSWEGRDLACLSRGQIRIYCSSENNVPFVGKVGYALMSRKIDGKSVELHPAPLTGANADQYPTVDEPLGISQANQQASSSLTGDKPLSPAEADTVSDPGGVPVRSSPVVKAKAKPRAKAKSKALNCALTSESESPPIPLGAIDSDASASTRLNSAVEVGEAGNKDKSSLNPKNLVKNLTKTRTRKKSKSVSCITCEHNIFTHFPKDPNCEVCIASKPTRAQCRTTGATRVDALPPPKEWLDAITLDHKVINEADKSAEGYRAACVICDRATYWIQGYPAEHKDEADTVKALVEFAGPQGRAKHIYSDNSGEIKAACETLGWPRDPSLPHRPQTNGIAENAVKKVSEGTSCCLVQSRLSDERWPYAMRCFCFLRNIVDVLFHGSTAWKQRFGQDFKEAILPFGCEVTYLPRWEAEKSKLHAFGDKWLQGIFLGYV